MGPPFFYARPCRTRLEAGESFFQKASKNAAFLKKGGSQKLLSIYYQLVN
ncbi:hypothetical protein [Komagataeibacter sp. FNDCR2]|nr:hypothetical protein [Komagataeibacter sp. FNDCR2]MCE2575506.1 hypothetical protein [Komagataeibacter sp. FNDCR2]